MASRFVFSALLATTTIATLTSEASAFEVKHSASGQLVSWHRTSVAWTVDRSVRKVPGGEEAVAAAAAAWTQRSGAPALAVAAVDAKLSPGLDGTNAVFFVEGGFAPAGNALAVTVLSFDETTGDVLDADIVLNGKYQLGLVQKGTTHPTAITDPGGEIYDIDRVLAHEMGHALALSDEPADTSALMYPCVSRAVALATSRRELAASFEAKATVTSVSTTSVNGLFRSEVEVATTWCTATDCPPAARFVTWGGTIDHVRQEIGGVQVPAAGDAVLLVLDQQVIRSMTRMEK